MAKADPQESSSGATASASAGDAADSSSASEIWLPIIEVPVPSGPGTGDPFGIMPPMLFVGYDHPLTTLEQLFTGDPSGGRTFFPLEFSSSLARDLWLATADDLKFITLRPTMAAFAAPNPREQAIGRLVLGGAMALGALLTPGPQDDIALTTGAVGSSAIKGGARITSGSQVTGQLIRDAMKDARLVSQQVRGVSLPRVQQYVDRLLAGETAPAIKVDGRMIVDGNHRYIAGRILGQEPSIQPWLGGRPGSAISWDNLPINPEAW